MIYHKEVQNINVRILWIDVNKMDNLNLHQKQKVIYPQIHIPNSNRPLN